MLREQTRPLSRFGVTRRAAKRPLPTERGVSRLRRAFFATAAHLACRYNVDSDRVMVHLWEVRQANPRFRLSQVTFMDDLVHAIACVDESILAWAELNAVHERGLVRRCRLPNDEIASTMMIRRLFAELRRRHRMPSGPTCPSLRDYAGDRPLRNWLNDRLNALRAREMQKARVLGGPPIYDHEPRVWRREA